ncbi:MULTISPECIES: NAD(+) synthase [Candidatus Ichthyocystis]|uniref:Glutamine-dependent NAD(+) synthetase n=1 Tax=Candidatus Ichthyocystis hellenicum TaxID=1561003 RepID=A0A0S4M8J3_9BURK|nr:MULTISPECIES: NAD(+) synthase [Ichthyocystis]CUT17716.1 NAD synthetase [Candidatus Ichthyocystis hellenicum]
MISLALAQISNGIGNISHRIRKILSIATEARINGASMVITPELSLCGCIPNESFIHDSFISACRDGLDWLCEHLPTDLAVVVGLPLHDAVNSSVVIINHRVVHTVRKFDAIRQRHCYKEYMESPSIFLWEGYRILLTMEVDESCDTSNCDIVIAIKNHQFQIDHNLEPKIKTLSDKKRIPFIHLNGTGSQDNLIFKGGSVGYNPDGTCAIKLPCFKECTQIVTIRDKNIIPQKLPKCFSSPEEEIVCALKSSLIDYCNQHEFSEVVIGLSGGIDSSLVLCIASDALGANSCHGLILPSRFNRKTSMSDAQNLANELGCRTTTLSIEPMLECYESHLKITSGIAHENLQSRIRAQIIMAYSNEKNALVINTSNKSERAIGYNTMYGDSIGGIALIGDLFKSEVYSLARWYRNTKGAISETILEKPPSAELRPNQKDSDSIPDYDILERVIRAYLKTGSPPTDIPEDLSNSILIKFHQSEHKRRQFPTVPTISSGPTLAWSWPTHWTNAAEHSKEQLPKQQTHSNYQHNRT